MNPRTRKVVLAAALLGTLGLVVADRSEDPPARKAGPASAGAPGSVAKSGTSPQPAAGLPPLELPERPGLGESRGELFSTQSFQPPAPKVIATPPAPVAPPMPYRFAGTMVHGDERSVMLSKGDLVFPIKEGETLDGAYRVDAIGEDRITLTYLPLRLKETIPVVSAFPPPEPKAPATVVRPGAPPTMPPLPTAAVTAPAAPAAASGNQAKADSGLARLHWEGPQKVRLGARFDVSLKLTSGQPLQASPMQLRFDPAYLELIGMKPGKYFGNGDRNFSYRASPEGSIFIGASNQNPVPAADAELLVLTFKPVKAAPAAELTMASLDLHGPAGRPIAFSQLESFKTAIAP